MQSNTFVHAIEDESSKVRTSSLHPPRVSIKITNEGPRRRKRKSRIEDVTKLSQVYNASVGDQA